MAVFKLCFLLGASLLSLQGGVALGDAQGAPAPDKAPSTKTQHISKRVDCRGPMNAARTKVGLPDFGQPTDTSKLPTKDEETVDVTQGGESREPEALQNPEGGSDQGATFLKNFCSALSQGATAQQKQTQEKGTYMYASFTSIDEGTCEAAVEYWKGAATNFPTLPPVYSSLEQLYTNSRNVSFVGLFNTSSSPTVDCAFITCNTQTEASKDGGAGNTEASKQDGALTGDSSSLASGLPSGNGNSVSSENLHELGGADPTLSQESEKAKAESRRLAAEENTTYGLLCLSSPQALKDSQAPFTQEQWDKITGTENSSAQPKVVGALAIAVLVNLFL